jgi:hypothetical protein
MEATWDHEPNDGYPRLQVFDNFEKKNAFWGYILRYGPDQRLAISTVQFEVASARNCGAGTRLMMGALALAKSHGVEISIANVVSPAAMRIRQKLFGDTMTIMDAADNIVSYSVNDAILELAHNQANPDPAYDGLNVSCDLTLTDTSQWPLPEQWDLPDRATFL